LKWKVLNGMWNIWYAPRDLANLSPAMWMSVFTGIAGIGVDEEAACGFGGVGKA
jgi:hypothetical protein